MNSVVVVSYNGGTLSCRNRATDNSHRRRSCGVLRLELLPQLSRALSLSLPTAFGFHRDSRERISYLNAFINAMFSLNTETSENKENNLNLKVSYFERHIEIAGGREYHYT